MKKYLAIALCALTFASFGAVLFSQKNPVPGNEIEIKNYGRVSSVDVFSTVKNGTVELSRIFTAPIYTNAYDIIVTVDTNIVNTPVHNVKYTLDGTNDFTCTANGEYMVIYRCTIGNEQWSLQFDKSDGKWQFGTTAYVSYEEGAKITAAENAESLAFNFLDVDYTLARSELYVDNWSTNVVTTVTTNSVTPVKHYDLVVTNLIFSGSCSNNCFHGSPSPDLWIFNNDRILFSGTAVGGELRMVVE